MALLAGLLLFVASCGGGGCAGMPGLPGGFPADQTVENAGALRISRPGLDFLEKEIGPLAASMAGAPNGLALPIPSSEFRQPDAFTFIIDFDVIGTICVGGPDPNASPPRCMAEANIGAAAFRIDAVTPDAIELGAVVPVRISDTPVSVNVNPGPEVTLHVAYGANGTCTGPSSDRPSVEPKQLPVKVRIPLVPETALPRSGYTKIDIENTQVDLAGVSGDDVRVCADCGPLTFELPLVGEVNLCNLVLNAGFIKTPIVNALRSGLGEQLKSGLHGQLCTKPNLLVSPGCPAGSSPNDAGTSCVYDTDRNRCVPTLLGGDTHVDLGGLFRALSPNTTGGLDLGLASFGPMIPAPSAPAGPEGRTPNGITLGFAGGALPRPVSNCVTPTNHPRPTGIALPDELSPAHADAPGTPHVGISLAGRFIDHALAGAYDSGALCLGVSTEQLDVLKTGLLSLLVPSLKTLTFEQGDAAAAIVTRPQEPPRVKLGSATSLDADPLLLVTVPRFAIDFYVWTFDRFARVFTYTGDLEIPVNLQVAKTGTNPSGGLLPTIGEMKLRDGGVSNADALLLEDPNIVAGAISGLFGTVAKQLLGTGVPAIDLGSSLSSLGVELEVNTIKKLTKGADDYVGIFATMKTRPTTGSRTEAGTEARIVDKHVWKDHLQASTYDHDKLPELSVEVASPLEASGPVEFSWWIDEGTRSPWSPAKRLVIKDDQLFVQGRHTLHVSSRIVGDPRSEAASPAAVPYVIDALAPFVKVEQTAGAVAIETWDLVSAADALVARYRLDDGAFGPWKPAAEIAHVEVGAARTIEVEVEDEEGNVGTVRQALVRGRPDPTLAAPAAGCSCTTAGDGPRGDALAPAILAFVAVGLAALRRRGASPARGRRTAAVALGAIVWVGAASQGCSCGEGGHAGPEAPAITGCGSDCNQPCAVGLAKGQPGAYLSVAKAEDGTLWAAGYNDALLSEGDAHLWGDLVVGAYDSAKSAIDWTTVDGVPARTDGTCGPYEPMGWRGGELEPGDNVGRWASIEVGADGGPMVSYYDDTNHRSKFAVLHEGEWNVFVLREAPSADIGRYGKMTLVDGKPIVAFLHVEPGDAGHTRSKVVLARSRVARPTSADDFAFEDIAVDEDGPCTADGCRAGEACIAESGTCRPVVGGCTSSCSDAQACVTKDAQPQCLAKGTSVETVPRALGAHVSIAQGPDGLGVVLYDGFHGNLVGLRNRGTAPWERTILDGETGDRAHGGAIDTGDVGGSASLAIASDGTWHVSYVNGSDETLRYLTVVNGKPSSSAIVDDGTSVDGARHPDGKHLVGDDSTIRVDPAEGAVTILYSDSTSLGVRRAVRAAGAQPWALTAVRREDKWMAFPRMVPGDDRVAVWWRQSTRATKTVEGDVLVTAP